MGSESEPLRHIPVAAHQASDQLADQRRELRAVTRTRRADHDRPDPVEDEVLARRGGVQAGRLASAAPARARAATVARSRLPARAIWRRPVRRDSRPSSLRHDMFADLAVVAPARRPGRRPGGRSRRRRPRGSRSATVAPAGRRRGKWKICCWVTCSGGSSIGRPAAAPPRRRPPRQRHEREHARAVGAAPTAHRPPTTAHRRCRIPHVGPGAARQRDATQRRPRPASIVPACGVEDDVARRTRIPGQRRSASGRGQHLVRHAGVGSSRRRPRRRCAAVRSPARRASAATSTSGRATPPRATARRPSGRARCRARRRRRAARSARCRASCPRSWPGVELLEQRRPNVRAGRAPTPPPRPSARRR